MNIEYFTQIKIFNQEIHFSEKIHTRNDFFLYSECWEVFFALHARVINKDDLLNRNS